MIKPTFSSAITSPNYRNDRPDPVDADGPSFELELAAEEHPNRPAERLSSPRQRPPKKRDTPAATPALNALRPSNEAPLRPMGDDTDGVTASATPSQNPWSGGPLSLEPDLAGLLATGAQAAPEGEENAEVFVELTAESAESALKPVVAEVAAATLAHIPDGASNAADILLALDALDDEADGDAREIVDAHAKPDAPALPLHTQALHRPTPVVALDASRAIADQLAHEVAKLHAEASDRVDVVRFRAADFTFSAYVRQDAGMSHVRLVSDDPNTRLMLGDRLPEVRQALERVGFASTGLSVGADADRHSREQRGTPDDTRDEWLERVEGASEARKAAATSTSPTGPARLADAGLNLIL